MCMWSVRAPFDKSLWMYQLPMHVEVRTWCGLVDKAIKKCPCSILWRYVTSCIKLIAFQRWIANDNLCLKCYCVYSLHISLHYILHMSTVLLCLLITYFITLHITHVYCVTASTHYLFLMYMIILFMFYKIFISLFWCWWI